MARNQQSGSGSWNDNNRYSQSEDRIMRRGDDRTVESRDWGSRSSERNSYRGDDYPTDKETYRAGDDRHDRDMSYGQYGNRNNQMHGQSNYTHGSPQTFSADRNYGWSPDYRSSSDYRTGSQWGSDSRSSNDRDYSYDRSFDRDSSSGYGSRSSFGSSGADRSYRGGSSTFGPMSNDSFRGGSFGSSGYGSGYGSSGYSSDFRSSAADNRSGTMYAGNNFGGSSSWGQQEGSHYGKGPKNYRRSDDRIKEDVSDALERNPEIDASEIELDVKDGVVTMRGHVENRRTKRLAEDVIENMYGVKDVRNELTVDQSLFTQAKNALFGETAESQAASSTNANKSTAMKSKH